MGHMPIAEWKNPAEEEYEKELAGEKKYKSSKRGGMRGQSLNVQSKMVIGWAESCLCEVTASIASTHNGNQAVCPVSQHFS